MLGWWELQGRSQACGGWALRRVPGASKMIRQEQDSCAEGISHGRQALLSGSSEGRELCGTWPT